MNKMIRNGLIVSSLLIGFVTMAVGCGGADKSKTVVEPLKKKRCSEWRDVNLDMLSVQNTQTNRLCAKRAEYSVREDDMPPDVDGWQVVMTVFVTERGDIWVGPEQDFYIETDSGVIGGKMFNSRILWCESLIRKHGHERCDVGKALDCLKSDVSGARLIEANRGSDNKDENARRFTELRDFTDIFVDQGDGGVEKAQAAEVTGGIVRLDFKSSHHDTASAWIDIKSRKVVKTIVNGKQVYPQVYPQ